VGDLHVENFGTWRDLEGRLAWGINDFDEALLMPYTIDLVRLATSALLAIREQKLSIAADAACDAILDGYRDALASNAPEGFVLADKHPHLRTMALGDARDPARFWTKLASFPTAEPPRAVRKLLRKTLPGEVEDMRWVARVAGLGSLGRPRYAAYAKLGGGFVAREAKAALPSAYGWANGDAPKALHIETIAARAVRTHDPYYGVRKGWIVRRIAPDCGRIELSDYPSQRDERRLLSAMGYETANVHYGSRDRMAAVRRDLARRGRSWLKDAARRMADATIADWRDWKRRTA
jgi:hypothetical protein